jgi:hypothetical protein
LRDGSIDVFYSYQVLEHLHPEDGLEHLRRVFAALTSGGWYVCVTPHQLSGPHDVSRHFTMEPSGLHLHEYSVIELGRQMRSVGFQTVRALVGARGWYALVPTAGVGCLEVAIQQLPRASGRWLARTPLIRPLLGVALAARKA